MPRPDGNPLTIRSAFVAEEGYVFAQNDFSQVELRVMAEVSGDTNMLDEFLKGLDPYATVAAYMMGISYEDFCNLDKAIYKTNRQAAKAVKLGLQYGMQWKKLKNYAKQTYGVTMSNRQAEQYYVGFFQLYPGLVEYHNKFKDRNTLEAFSLPPFNRRRQWEEYPGVPQLSNHPVQSSSADITKLAMAKLYSKLHKDGYSPTQNTTVKPILTIH